MPSWTRTFIVEHVKFIGLLRQKKRSTEKKTPWERLPKGNRCINLHVSAQAAQAHVSRKPTMNSWTRHALCDSVLSYGRNRWKFEHVIRNSMGNEIWSIYNDKYFEIWIFWCGGGVRGIRLPLYRFSPIVSDCVWSIQLFIYITTWKRLFFDVGIRNTI